MTGDVRKAIQSAQTTTEVVVLGKKVSDSNLEKECGKVSTGSNDRLLSTE
jgi:hypothetical protein